MSKCESRIPVVRVSSANIKSASLRIRKARNVMSSKLPTGVGTMCNMVCKSNEVLSELEISHDKIA